MNTAKKLEGEVEMGEQEETAATQKSEQQPIRVVEREETVEPEEEKPAFYTDMAFWIRVATVLLLITVGIYFYTL